MPAGFVYDTEPASRAIIALAELSPDETFPYLKSIQAAFYAQRQDITLAETLAALAEVHQVSTSQFLERFHSAEVKEKTRQHFEQARQAGVRGFPTLLLQDESGTTLLSHGYRPFEALRSDIDAWLSKSA